MNELNMITGEIVDAAIRVHRELGPGLAERAYEPVLAARLRERGLYVARQVPVDIEVEGYRVSLLLNFRSALMKDGIIRIVNRLEE